MFASLPMYDLPEIRSSTDRYWQALRSSFLDHGIDGVPNTLKRKSDPRLDWSDPALFFSQTCGLPFTRKLADDVCLLGAPVHDLNCPAGQYYSVLIGREAGPETFSELGEYILACNDIRSQSGYAAFFQDLIVRGGALPSAIRLCGAHLKSIEMVAAGHCDVAAIDAVTFELAKRHHANMISKVKILGETTPMPALPYITSRRNCEKVETLRIAVAEAVGSLERDDMDALVLEGFRLCDAAAYQPIADGWQALVDRGWEDLSKSSS